MIMLEPRLPNSWYQLYSGFTFLEWVKSGNFGHQVKSDSDLVCFMF